MSNTLSHDHHLSDSDLLTLLYSAVTEQVPKGFKICPLPPIVISRIMTWLHCLLPAMQSLTEPQWSKITTGGIGKPTSKPSNLMTILSWHLHPKWATLNHCRIWCRCLHKWHPRLQGCIRCCSASIWQICATFDAVAQTFQESDLPSPCHDDNWCLAFILQ